MGHRHHRKLLSMTSKKFAPFEFKAKSATVYTHIYKYTFTLFGKEVGF
jgi:hypothetical protein